MTDAQRTDWKEIESKYPDMWAFIANVKRNNVGEMKSFELLNVCTKKDKAKWLKKYIDEDIEFECIRTTFRMPNTGVLGL